MEPRNATRETLERGEPTFGAWIASMSPRIAEALGGTGLDWAVVDMEHTPAEFTDTENVIRGIERAGLTPMVRIPGSTSVRESAKRVLDAGAQGIIVPRIETPEDAERAIRAARFPPDGVRGVAGSVRANGFGRHFEDYVTRANEEILVTIQLETRTGAERASEILSIEGLDGVFVGENDLSATYGAPGRSDRDNVQRAVDRIRETARENGVYTGIVATSPERIDRRLADGFTLLSVGSDLGFVSRAVTELL